ncbi:MAG: site-2 protease family protein [Patescibacteria group bacterium]
MPLLSLLFSEPFLFLAIVLAFLLALSIHELSHAAMALFLGDTTAKRLGRITLNPAAHVDIWGFLALVTVGFGWGKPVPFNPFNLRHQRIGPVLVAGAGPLSNVILGSLFAILGQVLLSTLGPSNLLIIFCSYSAYLNFLLALFNLIPIPPLDGSKALLALLSHPRYQGARTFLETQGPMLLIALIVLDSLFATGIFRFLTAGARAMTVLVGGLL